MLKALSTLGSLSGKPKLTKGDIKDHANCRKGSVINWLFGHDGYNSLSLQEHSHVESKFKLKGTINTDGLVLHLLAYDTTIIRPKAKKQAESDQQDDLDLLDQDEEDLDFECVFDELEEGQKLAVTDVRLQHVVFCIGLGTFRSQSGLPSMHSSLLKRLVIRVSLFQSSSIEEKNGKMGKIKF